MNDEREHAALAAWFGVVWKHKWLFLAFTGLVLTATVLFTRRQPQIYEASTQLVIELAAPQYLARRGTEVVSLGTGNSWNTREFFETQYRIIRSRMVARKVVDQLGLGQDLDFLGITQIEDEEKRARKLANADPVSTLVRRLSVDPVSDSRVVLIKFKDQDPERAARIADAVAEAYARQNVDRKVSAAGEAVTWLKSQANTLKGEMVEAENALLGFKRDKGIIGASLADRQNLIGLDLQDARRQLRSARRETAALEARLDQIKGLSIAEAGTSVDEILDNGLVQRLKEKQIALQNERVELLERYLSKHPDVKVVDQKLARVKKSLDGEIAGIRRSIQRRLDAALQAEKEQAGEVRRLEAQARELQAHELAYKRHETLVEQKKALHTQMLDRLKEAELQAETRANNVRVLDPALVPGVPVSPRLMTNLTVALALSLLGGLGLVLLVERLDNSVKNQQTLEAYGLTFLGVIPTIREASGSLFKGAASNPDRYVLENPNSTAAECVRTIRTNLLFMSSERELRSMMITSAGPREGKTSTCVNIGATMAMSGSRTLLVDSDLRRPRLHKIFDEGNDRGLTDLILDPSKDVGTLTRETGVEDLDLLCSGPLPPNPSELLHTQGFRKALDRLLEHYDRVIFDSPPVVAVTDAQILGQQVDGTVLVVRAGETSRPMLEKAARLLRTVNVNILGALLNNLDVSRRGYGEYYYTYYRNEEYAADEA